MDWYNRSKRNSISAGVSSSFSPSYNSDAYFGPTQMSSYYGNYHPLLPPSSNPGSNQSPLPLERNSYFLSKLPLYCSDWMFSNGANLDCIALSSYKEGFTNTIQVVHGLGYGKEAMIMCEEDGTSGSILPTLSEPRVPDDKIEGFDFHKVAEIALDYPVTNIQWDPSMHNYNSGFTERLATSSEVLRLYKVEHDVLDHNSDYKLAQTHMLVNNTASGTSKGSGYDLVNKYPPLTSFDWNKSDPHIIITSSVDTTCTVWDLHRSHSVQDTTQRTTTDTATVKTQLIAHDSEVFDVKFLHNSTNIFASVGNDGSMRIFDLRSLEHSTIIYEPPAVSLSSLNVPLSAEPLSNLLHSKALLKVSCSNVDQHHLATFGVNSNQILIIDMRMPGVPVANIDGSLGSTSTASINSIKWHPTSNLLLSGGDDCQALVWDCNALLQPNPASEVTAIIDTPVFAYEEDLEVNNVCWRMDKGNWVGVVSGKGFQAVLI
ncbi:uncharacterized protein PRCAT00001933001 [Priceomyces carsonii]|uniref:uncharacterized protein n=1 Tax=Priceomyces carsonii TaxID=28549 RepID=UPI002EDAA9E6|nr:unnamed protein product [Priceomyces carsonii]